MNTIKQFRNHTNKKHTQKNNAAKKNTHNHTEHKHSGLEFSSRPVFLWGANDWRELRLFGLLVVGFSTYKNMFGLADSAPNWNGVPGVVCVVEKVVALWDFV